MWDWFFKIQTNGICADKKRSVHGEPSCYELYESGVYFIWDECTFTIEEPQVPVPTGWQYFKFSMLENCNFTDIYEISAGKFFQTAIDCQKFDLTPWFFVVPDVGSNILVLQLVEGIIFIFNNTVSCNNEGILAIDTCFQYGCYSFESVPNGVCTNVTTATFDQFFNGIQTSCVAAPVSGESPGLRIFKIFFLNFGLTYRARCCASKCPCCHPRRRPCGSSCQGPCQEDFFRRFSRWISFYYPRRCYFIVLNRGSET